MFQQFDDTTDTSICFREIDHSLEQAWNGQFWGVSVKLGE